MAGEAVLMWELEPPIPFTCADGTGIEKGALLEMTDPMTVATANGDADVLAGIAAEEKIADDGKTTIPVYLRGVFRMLVEGALAVGEAWQSGVATGSANAIMIAAAGSKAAKVGGFALETGADGETAIVVLQVGCNGMAAS